MNIGLLSLRAGTVIAVGSCSWLQRRNVKAVHLDGAITHPGIDVLPPELLRQ
jgi:hypothetical protein